VQEEIKFSINPELTVSLLLCPVMLASEAIIIVGSEQMSNNTVRAYALVLLRMGLCVQVIFFKFSCAPGVVTKHVLRRVRVTAEFYSQPITPRPFIFRLALPPPTLS